MKDLDDLKKRAAAIIDCEWRYSWHWGKEPDKRHWTMDAKHDCIQRIDACEMELFRLKMMKKELEEIAPMYIPEEGK